MQSKRPSRQRLKLRLTDEEFFAACLLRFGAPDKTLLGYVSVRRWWRGDPIKGLGIWCEEAPEGRAFTAFVRECGDAKARAPLHYKQWLKWWKEKPNDRSKIQTSKEAEAG